MKHRWKMVWLVVGLVGIKIVFFRTAKSKLAATQLARFNLQQNAANAVANNGPTAAGLAT